MKNPIRGSASPAFSLTELMVVMAILAILVMLLMPSLRNARERSKTIGCLHNLRQLGTCLTLYASDHNGALVPAHYRTNDTVTGQAAQSESWVTILINLGYVEAPVTTSTNLIPRGPSILRCPSGLHEVQGVPIGCPTLPLATDPVVQLEGTKATSSYSASGNYWVYTWYGMNGVTADVGAFPFGRIPEDGSGRTNVQYMSQAKRTSRLVTLFDGVWVHNGAHQRINARHMNFTKTNVLFLDGHAETIDRKLLPTRWLRPSGPGGCPTSLSVLSSNAPTTNWRIDQE
jgi:prepilin-type N-terminal cleavage/methylation domain-containing protein/prepilin-type processing-associated H-X9-DG protein